MDNKTGKETYMRVASLGGGVGIGVKEVAVPLPEAVQKAAIIGYKYEHAP